MELLLMWELMNSSFHFTKYFRTSFNNQGREFVITFMGTRLKSYNIY